MIKIVRGNLVNTVSKSSFDNYFKSQGWELAGGENPPVSHIEPVEEKVDLEEPSDEEWDDVLDELKDDEVEKPISEMNKQELIAKAKSLGIDVTPEMTNKQLRELIKSHK